MAGLLPVPPVPTLVAVAVGDVKCLGRNRPIVMRCTERPASHPEEYVVKLYGDHWLLHRGLVRELYGALLGSVFALTVPPPALVDVTEVLTAPVPHELAERLQRSPGINLGSKHVGPGHYTPQNPMFLPGELLPAAAEVFAYDMLIQNPDRRAEKPNMFQTPDGFTIYDHEMAFPFAQPDGVLDHADAWELAKIRPMVTNHILYRPLKGKPGLTFQDFTEKLSLLTRDVLSTIASCIPIAWHSGELQEDLDNIAAFLLRATDHATEFRRSLVEVLA